MPKRDVNGTDFTGVTPYINCVFVMSCLLNCQRRLGSDEILESGVSVISRSTNVTCQRSHGYLCTSLCLSLMLHCVDKTANNTEQFVCFALVPVSVAM